MDDKTPPEKKKKGRSRGKLFRAFAAATAFGVLGVGGSITIFRAGQNMKNDLSEMVEDLGDGNIDVTGSLPPQLSEVIQDEGSAANLLTVVKSLDQALVSARGLSNLTEKERADFHAIEDVLMVLKPAAEGNGKMILLYLPAMEDFQAQIKEANAAADDIFNGDKSRRGIDEFRRILASDSDFIDAIKALKGKPVEISIVDAGKLSTFMPKDVRASAPSVSVPHL